MRKQLPVRALSYLKTHMQKKKWRRVVTVLSCIVVFCTTYALILPAVTMTQQTHVHTPEDCYEDQLVCGLEEHQHSLACYSDPEADLESPAVWERTIPQDLTRSQQPVL